ncbi:hypothetical protein EHQ53_10975 [Leptospira langatensis]|uniref:DUF5683 domain-containing protein n=1 Tax=Leptospira langatensis TaxID=2484983 RepID=A0A5F1ZV08_9LEPT|nr:hypothetical protein EHO57_15525 [Leptospira langatensis]TGL40763.1 hypothetical protein EHQ53_10975 [Leptospira langatensis]
MLRSGGKVVGSVVGHTERNITVQTDVGKKNISKRDILKIIYKDVSKEEEKRIRQEEEKKLQENPQQKIEEPIIIIEPPKQEAIGPGRNKWSAVWRSAILPGWGQSYTENRSEAILTGSVFLGTVALAVAARSEAESAKKHYDDVVSKSGTTGTYILGGGLANYFLYTQVPSARSEYSAAVQHYNEAVYVLGAVYLTQLVRSYFLGSSWAGQADAPVTWGVSPKPDLIPGKLGWGAEARLSFRF